MLVVDGIELILADEPLKMGKFERDHTVRSNHVGHSRCKVVKIRDLRQHIVADYKVSSATLGHQLPSKRQAEKLNEGRNILLLRGFGYVGGWLDTNYLDA